MLAGAVSMLMHTHILCARSCILSCPTDTCNCDQLGFQRTFLKELYFASVGCLKHADVSKHSVHHVLHHALKTQCFVSELTPANYVQM